MTTPSKSIRTGYGLTKWTTSWATSYGRLVPAGISIVGDPTLVLQALARRCQDGMNGRVRQRVAARSARADEMHTAMHDRIWNDVRQRWWDQRPIATARLAAAI